MDEEKQIEDPTEGQAESQEQEPGRDGEVQKMAAFLIARAEEAGGGLYALADAARSPEVLSGVFRFGQQENSLFKGLPEEPMADAAPYLLDFQDEPESLNWLISEGEGKSWAVLLVSSAPPKDVIEHFKQFISVKDENDTEMYFRFYDPRVLRLYLPLLSKQEAEVFHGPVSAFMIETPDGSGIAEYKPDEEGCQVSVMSSDLCFAEPNLCEYAPAPEDENPPAPDKWLIREEQMQALSLALRGEYLDRQESFIRTMHPGAVSGYSREEALDVCSKAVDQAELYGITGERDAAIFLEFVFELGVGFEQQKEYVWIRAILEDGALDGRAKVQLIRKGLAEKDPDPPESTFAISRAAASGRAGGR